MKMRILSFVLTFTAIQCIAAEQPNILWLTSEDNNINWVGCYGNPYAETPNIDRLAAEGFQYMHCYANAPVCAPSRSTWITGIHAVSMGTTPMRSYYRIPHDQIRYYPDYLKAAGYYCSNAKKTDYNIGGRKDTECWDSSEVDWEVLKNKQPFFQVINAYASHESRAHGSIENTTHDPQDTQLARYHPDIPQMRKNYAHYHDAVKKMDDEIGAALKALEESGMAGNTIVIYNSDHGGVLPRSKRFLFDSGTHSPLIIRIPEKFKQLWPADEPGTRVDRLVSFIDMPATWLKITGSELPEVMQGRVFLGSEADPEREYHVSYRERMDERCDNVRAIRNKNFLYIRNYMPFAPRGQHLSYLWNMEATRAWEAWHKAGKTDEITGRWFKEKPVEELYDTSTDPDNVVNLIDNPEYKEVAEELRRALRAWQLENYDAGLLPEEERVKRAERYKTTVYEMVRNREQYDLEAYLDAADLALEQNPDNLEILVKMLDHDDSGIRYWGMVGCCLLGEKALPAQPRIRKALSDPSHVVRAMAAFTLYRQGDAEASSACLTDLLKKNSYASLLALNIVDWVGSPAELKEVAASCNFGKKNNENRMKKYFEEQ